MFRVIKAYSVFDPDVGYCQGSPFIAGLMLLHLDEEAAFRLFVDLMRVYKFRGLFRPSMGDLSVCM